MLGYCRIDKDELKLKDYRTYTAYYCTLCHSIGKRYGQIFRFTLSNDMTFALICLDSIGTSSKKLVYRCPYNPLKKTTIAIDERALDYVAFWNYYLMVRKLKDNICDASYIFSKLMFRFLLLWTTHKKQYKRDSQKYADLISNIDEQFSLLTLAEKSGSSFDRLTNMFGEIIANISYGYIPFCENTKNIEQLACIFFNIGKWIYIADALDDFHSDTKKGCFNLLSTMQISSLSNCEQHYLRRCSLMLRILQNKMLDTYLKIKWNKSEAIISNIMFSGTTAVFKNIVARKYTPSKK